MRKKLLFLPLLYIGLLSFHLKAQQLYLNCNGANQEETKVINAIGYTKKHASVKQLTETLEKLRTTLEESGYFNARFEPLTNINDSTYQQKINLHHRIQKIRIYYKDIDKKILSSIADRITDDFFEVSSQELQQKLSFLNEQIANTGKPFSYVQLNNLTQQNDSVLQATLQSPKIEIIRKIDSIVIKGYEKFPRGYVSHFLRLKKGQVFNKSKIDKKVAQLNNLRFASSIRPPEVLFTKDKTDIYLYLEKENANMFDGFLGFATNEETNNLELNGYINLQLTNNLNFGESLIIQYKSDGNEQQRFQANLKLPFLVGSPVGTELNLDIFRKDSTFTTSNQQAKLTYQLNNQIQLKTGYESNTSNYLLETEPVAGTVNKDYTAQFFTLGGEFQILNNRKNIYPIKSYTLLETGIGSSDRKTSTTKQWRIIGSAFHIFKLNPRNSIYIRNETGFLESDNYLTNELFRFGGIQSLRGFEENSLFASFYSSLQTEYRYLLSPSLYVHSIIDFARTRNEVNNNQSDNLYGIGFGIGLRNQAGLLKLNFANGKTNDQNFEFKNTKIHLSLTTFF